MKERGPDGREREVLRRRFGPELIEMQLDHRDTSVRKIYNRDDRVPERIDLMQHWSDMIDTMRASGNVVPIKAA